MRYYRQWVCSNPSESESTPWMHRYISAINRNETFASLCIPKSMGYVMSFYCAMRDGNDRLALFNMKRFPMQPRDVPPFEGFSALEWASTLDLHDVMRALIRAGCDPDKMMPCDMPLIVFLSSLNKERAVTVLLEMGANVNAAACDGNTALHKCAETGNIALARVIINHGGDVCLRNHRGFTPLHCAVFSNHYDVMRLMLAARDGGPSFLCLGDFPSTKRNDSLPMVRNSPEKLKC
jgi:ankyrin repeat protein